MNNIEQKIKFIDKLTNSDDELEKYVSLIEKQITSVPLELEEKLISHFSSPMPQGNFMQNTFNVLKIVACTAFALIMWNYIILLPNPIPSSNNSEGYELYQNTNSYLEEKLKLANEFLLTPKKIERNDT